MQRRGDSFAGFESKYSEFRTTYNTRYKANITDRITHFDVEPNNASTMAAVVLMLVANMHHDPPTLPHINMMSTYTNDMAADIDPAMFEPFISLVANEKKEARKGRKAKQDGELTLIEKERHIKFQEQFIRTLSIVHHLGVQVEPTLK